MLGLDALDIAHSHCCSTPQIQERMEESRPRALDVCSRSASYRINENGSFRILIRTNANLRSSAFVDNLTDTTKDWGSLNSIKTRQCSQLQFSRSQRGLFTINQSIFGDIHLVCKSPPACALNWDTRHSQARLDPENWPAYQTKNNHGSIMDKSRNM